MTLDDIVMLASKVGATDVHLIQGLHPLLRVDGFLRPVEDIIVTDVDCDRMALKLIGAYVDDVFKQGEIDVAQTLGAVRCRISIFRQQGVWSLAIRLLSDIIPELDSLGLPKAIYEFLNYQQGLVLVSGKTGSGKSTTIAALLDYINHSERKHIITLEDPVEYVYRPDKCAVNQREVGKDTQTFASGLRAALREDPDIILVGELRDYETIDVALTASETGHLVLGTVHSNSAATTVERIVGVFPAERQHQVRMQLSLSLRAVLCQQLLPRVGSGRVLACEVMLVEPTIQKLIHDGDTPHIPDIIKSTSNLGNLLMVDTLKDLFMKGLINEKVYKSTVSNYIHSSFTSKSSAS